ncbi:GIY-YIG nuclease family protein [Candidatus Deferrimicrobium sp.]|uniref:GIY-YIG nuclease family protein n=1 Tax=Candidatus Deferrimicrobium sp. TaxID=3060586 RepID=UPI003C66AB3C
MRGAKNIQKIAPRGRNVKECEGSAARRRMEVRAREVARQAPGWEDGTMDGGNGGKTWWVYMVSCRGGKIYTGTSIDPEARYEAHRTGKGAAFTRANPPVALLRCVPFPNRSEACRAEAALRKMPREKKISWARE